MWHILDNGAWHVLGAFGSDVFVWCIEAKINTLKF
jgi:hypothetical protein